MARLIPVKFLREKGNTFRGITFFLIKPEFPYHLSITWCRPPCGNISAKKCEISQILGSNGVLNPIRPLPWWAIAQFHLPKKKKFLEKFNVSVPLCQFSLVCQFKRNYLRDLAYLLRRVFILKEFSDGSTWWIWTWKWAHHVTETSFFPIANFHLFKFYVRNLCLLWFL